METIDARSVAVIWIEDGKIHLNCYIHLYIMRRSWLNNLQRRDKCYFMLIYTVTLVRKIFSCMGITWRRSLNKRDYSHIFYPKCSIISPFPGQDLKCRDRKNRQLEWLCLSNWKTILIYLQWKLRFVGQV